MSHTPPEQLKASDPTLAGTIHQTLSDPGIEKFGDDDNSFLKAHGIYQEDDRDLRKTGKKYILMVRCRIPGGIVTADQYLAVDDLATRYGNDTLRVTSRQGLQFHHVVKKDLRALVKGINDTLLTTLAACGDNTRNIMAPPAPAMNGLAAEVREHARQVAVALAPRTPSYHAIWIDGTELKLNEPFEDPLYGKTYLPRKFKICFAIPPHNDVDIFTNCCGFIAIAGNDGAVEAPRPTGDSGRAGCPNPPLLGYNLIAGGGQGRSHGNTMTYPRMADVIGFLPADKVVDVARAVLTIHRDFGDRTNRKHARLKYVLAERGAAWFREELDRRLGWKLENAKPYKFTTQGDPFGWHRQADGRMFVGLFVETGRIKGEFKTVLRNIVEKYRPEIRLTPGNNVILANIKPEDQSAIDVMLGSHGRGTILRRASMACVALPTCGLAVAEAERYLPSLVGDIEKLLDEVGLSQEEIFIRMTGCPNGCARPYMAEIAFVGKSPGLYQMWFGGDEANTRLNRVYKEAVKDKDIIAELRPVLTRFKAERKAGERFGDWCVRALCSK
jgi:sulfite reductase (NADPH) hemoprotein beta-component